MTDNGGTPLARLSAPLHLPAEEEPRGRFILSDGALVILRESTGADRAAMRAFFHNLSRDHLYQRFGSLTEPDAATIDRLCDSTDPASQVTLVAIRVLAQEASIIGTGSYFRIDETTAEVAFAVADAFRARGIASGILERLSIEGARHGVRRFRALSRSDNVAMLDVFARSGFRITASRDSESVEVELDLTPTVEAVRIAEAHEQAAVAKSLAPFLTPAGVTVVGVSSSVGGMGRRVFDAIRRSGFRGSVFPVNGRGGWIDGVEAYASVRDLPASVDLAVIAVPEAAVPAAVDDCAARGVKALLVISAGFGEIGEGGRRRQEALRDQVRAYGLRMVGPNCMGLVNADRQAPLNASFSPIFPAPGRLALASQSGALGILVLALSAERHVGISSFVSLGNKADVSGNDLLQYWERDSATGVIGLYLESFGNPRRFARLARRVGRSKPIVAVKAGRTHAGSRAAGSHTAAMAASDTAVDALFRQTGVIRANTIDELIDIAACLETQPLPVGPRVAIVTNAGGPGILAADACESSGLSVATFSDATHARLRAALSSAATVTNPVDMVASAGARHYADVIRAVLADDGVDALIVLYTGVDATTPQEATLAGICDGVSKAREDGRRTPVLACVMGDQLPPPLDLGDERVPVYSFPENAVRALSRAASYAAWKRRAPGEFWGFENLKLDDMRALIRLASSAPGGGWLGPEDVRVFFDLLGAPLVPTVMTRSADEAAEQASRLGFPVVAKLAAEGLLHKTEVGGVIANIRTADGVRAAFDDLAGRARNAGLAFEAVSIQPMITGGVEAMVGVVRDPAIGALVGVGMGGTDVEVIGDVRFGLAPITNRDADEVLRATRLHTLLSGHRGRARADIPALTELLLRVSAAADAIPELAELDMNPVMVLPAGEGVRIVDARVRAGAGGAPGHPAAQSRL